MPIYYRNETLFSEIYLEEITRQPEQAEVLASLKVLREYREYADTSSLSAWKASYVNEVLSALGFYAQSESDQLTRLFPMGSTGQEQPVSLCYAVLPGENLDNTTIGRNWAEKITRALRENNLQWGLLTNGKQWRIYHLDEPTPYETYLEMDLEAVLIENAKEAYQIFHKFMKAENFAAQEDGKCQFDRFKQDSQDKIDYIEKELANALKQREGEGGQGVLSDICMGYVEELRASPQASPMGEGTDLEDEAVRQKIYHAAMLYMFRLLFLFYADARGLLSDENHDLLAQVEADCRRRHHGGNTEGGGFALWNRLETIFVDIDQTYNGGLFSPQESDFTRFLSEARIGDTYLAEAIYNLTTYTEKNGEEKPISYRDMGVRHLGTLYEGLLEHKLFIAQEDTEVKATKGKVKFIPASQGGKLVVGNYIKAGDVYFAGDPSERKSTGSYYTPEYIVDYIVRNTVGEKLKELKETFLKEQKPNLDAVSNAVDEEERKALASLLEENALHFVREKVLQLSALDPAMGSGHFLVNATNLISNFITDLLNELGIGSVLESGTAYWRRWVVENCIYGVDLNPLAVELAKLSLWILSMAKGQPLSFMNHHLKCGNSLVGARLEEIGDYPLSKKKKEMRQLGLFTQDEDFRAAVEKAISRSRLIAAKASTSLEDVSEKKVWLEEIGEFLEGYKAICDVHTNLQTNNSSIDEGQYALVIQKKDFTLARSLTPEKYFHWQLEFPFLLRENGFDSVVGNPPYVQLQTMGDMANTLQGLCFETFARTGDIYCLFYEQGVRLLRKNGVLGLITSNKWMRAGYGEKLRNFFAEKTNPSVLVDFSGQKIFESATVDVNILIVEKARNKNMTKSCAIKDLSSINNLSVFIEQNTTRSNYAPNQSWTILSDIEQRIKKKIEQVGIPLKDWDISINRGILTGYNEAFIITGKQKDELISDDPKSAEIIRPILRGRDIKRYGYGFADLWLINTHNGVASKGIPRINVNEFPAIKKHLDGYYANLAKRFDKGDTPYNLRSCDYLDDFNKQKIVYNDINQRLSFAFVEPGIFFNNTVYFISENSHMKYLLACLNSSVINWYYKTLSVQLGQNAVRMFSLYVNKIAIPVLEEYKELEFESLVDSIELKNGNNEEAENKIDSMLFDIYGLSGEEIDFIKKT